MSEYTKDDALAFVGSLRLMLRDRTGFKWLAEKLANLSAYIERTSAENERLNAYLDAANAREDYESFRAAHPDDAPGGDAGAQP